MENPRGAPIRSRDLQSTFEEQASRLVRAEETVEETRRSIRQVQLALQAGRAQSPKGQPSSAENGIMYADAMPSAGGGRVGPFVSARRLRSESVFYEAPQGTGAINALREGKVWARATGSAQATFEARLQPARLMRYNEVLVPHIAGQISVRMHHDQGSDRYGPFERSRLIRVPEGRRFNGRIEIDSQSRSTSGGQYVHAIGGLEIRDSDWTAEWDLTVEFEAPSDGTVELKGLSAHPGGQSLPFSVEDENGTPLTKTESVAAGDRLVLRAEEIDPTVTASYARIEYDYV